MTLIFTEQQVAHMIFILEAWRGDAPYDGTIKGSDNPSRAEAEKLLNKLLTPEKGGSLITDKERLDLFDSLLFSEKLDPFLEIMDAEKHTNIRDALDELAKQIAKGETK